MKANLKELEILGIMLAVFLAAYFIPFTSSVFGVFGAHMLQNMRDCVLLCLIPACSWAR